MKRIAFILLTLALLLSATACMGDAVSDVVRDNLGDAAADSFDAQRAQTQKELEAAGEEIGSMLEAEASEGWQSMKDQFQEQLDGYLESLLPSAPTQEELIAQWEALLTVTPGTIKDENGSYTACYKNCYSYGQCTWYALGRFQEATGIDLQMSYYGNAKTWLDNCNDDRVNVIRDPYAIEAGAIAVDYKTTDSSHAGHVTFVEYVSYDENGNPDTVYFTESNWDSNGHYDAGVDGVVKSLSFEEFINRGSHKVLGYIAPK